MTTAADDSEKMLLYDHPGSVDLDLADYKMSWRDFWQGDYYNPDSALNTQVLFGRALMKGKLPPQFVLRFGKRVTHQIAPRVGDKSNEICGLARYWLGSKLGGVNKRTQVPPNHPLLSQFEFVAIGCCGVQFALPDRVPRAPPRARRPARGMDVVDRAALAAPRERRASAKHFYLNDASTQTELTQEDLAEWFCSLPANQTELAQLQARRALLNARSASARLATSDSDAGDLNSDSEASLLAVEPPPRAARQSGRAGAGQNPRRRRLSAEEVDDVGVGGGEEEGAGDDEDAQERQGPAVCGAPVLIGRLPGSNVMRCQFLGPCRHGPNATCTHIHNVVKQELCTFLKGKDLSPGEIYEGIMRHFNAVMPPSLNTDAAPDATAGDAVGDEDAGPSAGPAAGGAAAGRSTGGTQTGGSHRRKSRPGTRDAGAGQGDDGGAQGAAPKRRKMEVTKVVTMSSRRAKGGEPSATDTPQNGSTPPHTHTDTDVNAGGVSHAELLEYVYMAGGEDGEGVSVPVPDAPQGIHELEAPVMAPPEAADGYVGEYYQYSVEGGGEEGLKEEGGQGEAPEGY